MIDGSKRWLALDFTLAEIRTLNATEGFKLDESGNIVPIYPERFPLFKARFEVPTLAEEIELIQGMNKSTGKDVGIYVEIKAPWLHKLEGRDISKATLSIIKSYGYTSKQDKAFIQCFDPDETQRIRTELYPELVMELPLIQLIAETSWNETQRLVNGELVNYSYDWIFEPGGIKTIAKYADGIGPWFPMLVDKNSIAGNIQFLPMLKEAQAAGLMIHPFTFRKDQGHIPDYAENFVDFLDIFYRQADVDGVFTDFPDLAVDYLNSHR
jgi:glycerophosphoryl diester phosphodiesterase